MPGDGGGTSDLTKVLFWFARVVGKKQQGTSGGGKRKRRICKWICKWICKCAYLVHLRCVDDLAM